MSHRKASKRRREKGEDDDFSPSIVPQKKRSKSQTGAGHGDHERPQQNIFVDDGDAGVRRSSRTPKPKVFDDEETAVIGRTPDSSSKPGVSGLIQTGEHSLSSANEAFEASISNKQRKAAAYDDGHKRETRRSYKDFLKELKTESSVVSKQRNDEFESEDQTNRRDGKTQKGNKYSGRRKSDLNVTPKSTGVKTPRDKGPSYTGVKRDTPDEASPKVRSSSRTPIPKRIFSLLEDEDKEEEKSDGSPGNESEPLDLTSPKVRSSSRAHAPKKSFPLLEKGDIDAKETACKQTTPEQTSSKRRTPKLHGTKRRLSAAEKESLQDLPANTPASSEEPSPKVRASSRGHMPKRTFSLLESDEVMDETKGDGNFSEKVHKLEGEKYVSRNPAEQQKADVMKEPKKQKSSNGQQVSGKQRSASKEGEKQAANHEGEKPRGKAVTVKAEDSEVGNTDIKTPSSSKFTPKRKGSIIGAKEDNDQGSSSRRKGTKPVKKKKKIFSSEQTSTSVLSATDVKVKVEPGFGSPSETSATPKTIKSKSSSKNKQSTASSVKQSLSLRKTVPAIKQEGVESNQDRFSLSDLAMGVTDNVKTSTDLNTSVLKGKRKGLGGKNIEEKSDKVKGKGKKIKKDSSNSGGETAEPEHIILKLHLPQSEESTKHKKHHHHHHHHHHKHKHSSGSHDDSSPKKSHHKKAAAKLPEVVEDPDASQKAETKKKRISIKFKGLSSKNIDLEMAADSPGLLQSVELGAAECSEANSPKQSMESDKKKRKSKQEDLSSSQSDSEHLKLVIKKDKLPAGNKTEVKKKKITQPTTSQAKAVVQKKKAAPVTGNKKGKGGATPKKAKKTPQKPKVVTSYLLFCKQHRKQIAEENPGLEFTEISKKVGTAWNNLPEEEKEHWRRKADELRKTLGLTSPKSSLTHPKGKDDKAEPIDVAAHLQLLGESLGTIGSCLRVQDPGEVHGSLSVLLDSALCAISPLLFLTSQVPELDGCSRKTQAEVLDNLAYLMPGLG